VHVCPENVSGNPISLFMQPINAGIWWGMNVRTGGAMTVGV